MMDLDSAIQHCKEQVQEQAKKGCYSCAEEHQQLAEWLKELKEYREFKGGQRMTIGEEVLIHGYIDEIRKDIVIIRNEGGYFGTVPEEIRSRSEIPNTCGDAISRQAVLDAMYELCSTGETLKENPWRDNPHIDAITDAIENLPSVTPQQRAEVLDKIREEIHATAEMHEDGDYYLRDEWIDEIIDKYKAESEDKK